jgi:hypothetical protein
MARSINEFIKIAEKSGGNVDKYFDLAKPVKEDEVKYFIKAFDDVYDTDTDTTTNKKPSNFKEKLKEGSRDLLNQAANIQSFGSEVISYNSPLKEGGIIAQSFKGISDILFSKTPDKSVGSVIGDMLSSAVGNVLEGGIDILKKEVELRNKINAEIGIGGELSRGLRSEILESLPVVEGMGFGFEDIGNAIVTTMKETGRFSLMNQETMEKMAVTSRAFTGDMEKTALLLRNFELIGVGAESALEGVNKIGQSSLNIGLQSRKVVAETQTNLNKINQYGFENGVNGLSRMVQKSIEFRISMDSAFQLADKVFSPEGAIELSANLQAIGGAIGDLNDPLKLMYMATNNVEGLQDAIIGVAGSLATYNVEQGRFEITGINLRRAKDLAGDLGISYDQLANTAIAAAERSSAAVDLLSSGLQLEDKEKEFLTNISRMEGGKMIIDVPKSLAKELGLDQTRIALDNLDQNTANALLSNQKYFEKLSPEEIAREQYSETQKLELSVREIATMLKVRFASTIRKPLSKIDDYLKEVNNYINPSDNKVTSFDSALDLIRNDHDKQANDYIKNMNQSSSDSKLTIDHKFSFNNVNSDELVRILMNNPQFVQLFNDRIKKNMNQGTGGGYSGF